MPAAPLIQFNHIHKRFPGVHALRDVTLGIERGAVHALCGENGAGKSTLGRILAGIHTPDQGTIIVESKPRRFHSPRDAMNAGIGMVHQEPAFCENLSVAENLCLGQLPRRGPFLSRRKLLRLAAQRLAAVQADIAPHRRVGELPVSQQQLVQIAAAVARGARILIFDEPTSSLCRPESQRLFALIKQLQSRGVTSLYVSHRLDEIFQLCDTITVLRDGCLVATRPANELDRDRLVQLMIGRPLQPYCPRHLGRPPGDELLRVENLCVAGKLHSISFALRAGEILGLAGLVGAGRTELAQALFGLAPLCSGKLFLRGKPVCIRSPVAAMRQALGLIPEDRKRHGLVLSLEARANISLPTLERVSRFGWVRRTAERRVAQKYFDALRVKAPSVETLTANLSGGTQQKIVLAKWLAADCRVLIVDEPTRGVDVGAKAEIHALIDQLAADGNGVLLISSDLPELLALSTRLLVLRAGRIAGELTRQCATQQSLMRLMAGIG
jgi:ABC-type sugar transport system ATPase subunit